MATQFAAKDIRGLEVSVKDQPMDVKQQEEQVERVEESMEPEPVKPASRFGCASE